MTEAQLVREEAVYLHKSFSRSHSNLPKEIQAKANSMLGDYLADPRHPGLRCHPIDGCPGDSNMWSARIDRAYRAVFRKADGCAIFLYAAHHDAAYDWAARHRCDIHADTGALQVYAPKGAALGPGHGVSPSDNGKLGAGPIGSLSDRKVAALGVPRAMVERVKAIREMEDIDRLAKDLPDDVVERMRRLFYGYRYEKVVPVQQSGVDTSDFKAALDRDITREHFAVIDNDRALKVALGAGIEEWRVFLHPSQRKFAYGTWNGPVRVLGGAGCGKTVVAMHRACWLAEQGQDRKVLFLTYNKDLSAYIAAKIGSIAKPNVRKRIEVMHFDKWLYDLRVRRGDSSHVEFGRVDEAWERALAVKPESPDLPDAFFDDEWEKVISANAVTNWLQYRDVSRVGRGTSLSRMDRYRVWPVFKRYLELLDEQGVKPAHVAYREALNWIESGACALEYTSAVVDEVQDLSAFALRILRRAIPKGKNDLFLVGDAHQRIFGGKVVLRRCGIEIRGRSHKLELNYRTTEQTRAWAARLLEGRPIDDLDGGEDSDKQVRSMMRGPAPKHFNCKNFEAQLEAILEHLRLVRDDKERTLDGVCIATPKKEHATKIADSIAERGFEVCQITDQSGIYDGPGVRVTNMHRVKGLEFDEMILASMNRDLIPRTKSIEARGDPFEREQEELKWRSLLYVAATRARRQLLLFSYGEPSPFLTETREPRKRRS